MIQWRNRGSVAGVFAILVFVGLRSMTSTLKFMLMLEVLVCNSSTTTSVGSQQCTRYRWQKCSTRVSRAMQPTAVGHLFVISSSVQTSKNPDRTRASLRRPHEVTKRMLDRETLLNISTYRQPPTYCTAS